MHEECPTCATLIEGRDGVWTCSQCGYALPHGAD
jgi:ribosomal protein L37AE/L43A